MTAIAKLISGIGERNFAKGTLAILIALTTSASGCKLATDRQADIAAGCPELRAFDVSAASATATRAVQSGDKKLLAVRGYAIEIPGIFDVHAARKKYGIFIIPGTSDAIANRTCGILNDQAISYAKIYNRTVTSLAR
jgi:hypothetical protein